MNNYGGWGYSNPTEFLAAMAQQNPQYAEIQSYVAQNGGNPQQAFFAKAQELGLTPEQAMQKVTQQMQMLR